MLAALPDLDADAHLVRAMTLRQLLEVEATRDPRNPAAVSPGSVRVPGASKDLRTAVVIIEQLWIKTGFSDWSATGTVTAIGVPKWLPGWPRALVDIRSPYDAGLLFSGQRSEAEWFLG